MISVSGFYKHIEKNAGVVGEAIEGIFKTMWKYPKTTIGIGLGTLGALALGNKIHPLHQILSEERKRGLMKDQRQLLGEILTEQRKGNAGPAVVPEQKLIVNPLV
jgi:hypothetical protein